MHEFHRRLPRVIAVEAVERRTLLSIATPSFASSYQPVFTQDFTLGNALSVSASGPVGADGTTWISHKPRGGDFFAFGDPGGATSPFSVDSNGLTIRVQKNGNANNGYGGFTGGLLSSVDNDGNGFAQQYGYFEVSMRTPGGPNSWPAFWLLNRNALVNPQADAAEIDVTESYGNFNAGPGNVPAGKPDVTTAAWHSWNADGTRRSDGHASLVAGLSTGYHTYGVDVEPTGMTYYVDRQLFWSAPILEAARQPLYVLLDNALGGGSYNNATGTGYDFSLTPATSDLSVRYVSVWASPASPNYRPSLSAVSGGMTIGTTGSWLTGDSGVVTAADGASAAFDGNLATAFDAPSSSRGNGAWVGQDLGSPKLVTELSFAPRSGFGDRMLRGKFQASNSADFSSGVVDLYTVATVPTAGLHTVAVNGGAAFRYVRYLSPTGGWGNVAEVSFKTLKAPAAVTGLTAVASTGSQVRVAWNAVEGASGYNVYRGGALIASNVADAAYVDLTVTSGVTYSYAVAATNPSGAGPTSAAAIVTPAGSPTADLAGTTIGTPGSWFTGDSGLFTASDGAAAAFDGNLATAFDAPQSTRGNNAWVGKDLGAPKVIAEVRFAPRAGFADRMVGGKFQASNVADFSSGVVELFTITGTPTAALQAVAIATTDAYRYVRYLSPAGGWGNVAELVFRGSAPTTTTPPTPPVTVPPVASPPAAPTSLAATANSTSAVSLAWTDNSSDEGNFIVERKRSGDATWSQIAMPPANATSYADAGLAAATIYFYRVRAVSAAGASGYSNEASATTAAIVVTPPPPVTPPTPPVAKTPIVVSTVVSTGSRQAVVGTSATLSTDAPGGNWVWGAGWSWATPFASATWDAPNVPANAIDLPEENTALGVSLASSGAYVKPTSLTISGKLFALGNYSSTIGLGFWSTMPPRSDGGSSLKGFSGLALDQASGTLRVYANGAATGSSASVGSIVGNVGYAVSYSVDTNTGGLSNVTFNGVAVAGLSSSGFTNAATAYGGVMNFAHRVPRSAISSSADRQSRIAASLLAHRRREHARRCARQRLNPRRPSSGSAWP